LLEKIVVCETHPVYISVTPSCLL